MTVLVILGLLFLIIGWLVSNGSSKTQSVRLFDVFLYAPLKMYIGYKMYTEHFLHPFFGLVLFASAAGTLSFNLHYYLKYNGTL